MQVVCKVLVPILQRENEVFRTLQTSWSQKGISQSGIQSLPAAAGAADSGVQSLPGSAAWAATG
jgi:hypothetical protein